MPLTRQAAKVKLVKLMEDLANRTVASPQDREDYADALIDIVADLATSMTGNVQTTGSAAAQAGPILTATLKIV